MQTTGGRTTYVSGQVPYDVTGRLVDRKRLAWLATDAMSASATVQAASIDLEILLEVDMVAVSHSPAPVTPTPRVDMASR